MQLACIVLNVLFKAKLLAIHVPSAHLETLPPQDPAVHWEHVSHTGRASMHMSRIPSQYTIATYTVNYNVVT